MTATLHPQALTYRNAHCGPPVEIEATRPGPIQGTKFVAAEAGERFRVAESTGILLEFHGKARAIGERTPAGRDYRADLEANWAAGRPIVGYEAFAAAYLRPGPTDPGGDVGPPIRARVIDGHSFVVAHELRPCGEFVRRTEPGANGRDIYKPGEPFELAEGLLAVPFYNRWVELLGEPTPRFRRFVDAYAEYRHRCEKTANPGACPEY